jgi:predicted AlkP superfamily phosphohydrolase/phosphomutase
VGSELKERLEALGDDQGRPIGTIVHRPEELYAEARGIAPDLLVYFGDLYWRSVGQVGTGTVHVFENDTGPDDANHAHEGLYVLAAEGVPAGRGPQRALHDVAPTLLELLGEPVPPDMEGQSMLLPAASDAAELSVSRDDSVTDTRTFSH